MEKLMNKYSLLSILAAMPLLAAAQPAEFKASVTVRNIFTFENAEPLSFGTIRASGDTGGVETATLVIAANPNTAPRADSTDVTKAEIAILEPGTPAKFTVDGVSPYATLTITDPTETDVLPIDLPPTTPGFKLGTFTYYVTSGTSPAPATTTVQADADGKIAFNVGATLTTTSAAAGNYIDGEYEGTFSVELSY
ncbi:DUF4402 domain-containing protein [Pseudoalteromonas sp. OOF1S-7]|nr:DUF4402 domain-containing protein [Pseudoalteromonas sp. OOF1S-7]